LAADGVLSHTGDPFKVVVIKECVLDRGHTSHQVKLFDMQAKYADLVPLAAAPGYLDEFSQEPCAARRSIVSAST
jgi:hypothetical protein